MPNSHITDQPIALFKIVLCRIKKVVYVSELRRADPNLYKPNNHLLPLSIYVRHLLLPTYKYNLMLTLTTNVEVVKTVNNADHQLNQISTFIQELSVNVSSTTYKGVE